MAKTKKIHNKLLNKIQDKIAKSDFDSVVEKLLKTPPEPKKKDIKKAQ